ncbi:hypothetical protein HETIRDRAFT_456450 [Heterobasidion irregulare TC 32-1]|uniref:Uncharacterized protein n=1 Tax=Heterobasidion irregulare (strain TC 32-1) TaxID=747525 RepID=W4JNB1_HETIT|nr:uncharacterized protein HETIRDRAFT_456450 [Heterobasidion irregulare TC 32-1]ETW74964.1 hypothetical protein HETIRDRAFT_456450 [Heterobasidion irregulare TC 32-1]
MSPLMAISTSLAAAGDGLPAEPSNVHCGSPARVRSDTTSCASLNLPLAALPGASERATTLWRARVQTSLSLGPLGIRKAITARVEGRNSILHKPSGTSWHKLRSALRRDRWCESNSVQVFSQAASIFATSAGHVLPLGATGRGSWGRLVALDRRAARPAFEMGENGRVIFRVQLASSTVGTDAGFREDQGLT